MVGYKFIIRSREYKDDQKIEYHQQQKESQTTPKILEKSEDKQVFQDTQMEILNAIKKLGKRRDRIESRKTRDYQTQSQRERNSSRGDWRNQDSEDW